MNTLIKLKLRQTALLLSFWNGSYYLSSFFATCLHDVLTLYFIEMSFDMFSINTNYQLANKNIIKIDGWEMVKWIIRTSCRFVYCLCWAFFSLLAGILILACMISRSYILLASSPSQQEAVEETLSNRFTKRQSSHPN